MLRGEAGTSTPPKKPGAMNLLDGLPSLQMPHTPSQAQDPPQTRSEPSPEPHSGPLSFAGSRGVEWW